jgi:hypothetical protein
MIADPFPPEFVAVIVEFMADCNDVGVPVI